MEHQRGIHPIYQAHSPVTHRGVGHNIGTPVGGRLRFGAEMMGKGAQIAVLMENCTETRIAQACDDPFTVGCVFVGENLPHALKEAAHTHKLPLLMLDSLPSSHNAEVAILDAAEGILIVNPDVDVLARYASAALPPFERAPLAPALSSCYPSLCADGFLFPAPIEESSQDALFECYRDATEAASPAPLYVILSAKTTPEDLSAHLTAILRAAVFGPVTLLWDRVLSPREMHETDELLDKCRASLVANGREHNAHLLWGLWISSPLSLFALPKFPPISHVALDLSRLLPASLGIQEGEAPPKESLSAFCDMLCSALCNRARTTISVLLPKSLPASAWQGVSFFDRVTNFFEEKNEEKGENP